MEGEKKNKGEEEDGEGVSVKISSEDHLTHYFQEGEEGDEEEGEEDDEGEDEGDEEEGEEEAEGDE